MAGRLQARLEKNAPGEWYTTGDCMACGAPEAEAPDLFSPLTDEDLETYFARQPTTPEDVISACRAARACCVSAVRYAGRDPAIIEQLGNSGEYSDYVIGPGGRLYPAPVWTFATTAAPKRPRWWQFWKRDRAS